MKILRNHFNSEIMMISGQKEIADFSQFLINKINTLKNENNQIPQLQLERNEIEKKLQTLVKKLKQQKIVFSKINNSLSKLKEIFPMKNYFEFIDKIKKCIKQQNQQRMKNTKNKDTHIRIKKLKKFQSKINSSFAHQNKQVERLSFQNSELKNKILCFKRMSEYRTDQFKQLFSNCIFTILNQIKKLKQTTFQMHLLRPVSKLVFEIKKQRVHILYNKQNIIFGLQKFLKRKSDKILEGLNIDRINQIQQKLQLLKNNKFHPNKKLIKEFKMKIIKIKQNVQREKQDVQLIIHQYMKILRIIKSRKHKSIFELKNKILNLKSILVYSQENQKIQKNTIIEQGIFLNKLAENLKSEKLQQQSLVIQVGTQFSIFKQIKDNLKSKNVNEILMKKNIGEIIERLKDLKEEITFVKNRIAFQQKEPLDQVLKMRNDFFTIINKWQNNKMISKQLQSLKKSKMENFKSRMNQCFTKEFDFIEKLREPLFLIQNKMKIIVDKFDTKKKDLEKEINNQNSLNENLKNEIQNLKNQIHQLQNEKRTGLNYIQQISEKNQKISELNLQVRKLEDNQKTKLDEGVALRGQILDIKEKNQISNLNSENTIKQIYSVFVKIKQKYSLIKQQQISQSQKLSNFLKREKIKTLDEMNTQQMQNFQAKIIELRKKINQFSNLMKTQENHFQNLLIIQQTQIDDFTKKIEMEQHNYKSLEQSQEQQMKNQLEIIQKQIQQKDEKIRELLQDKQQNNFKMIILKSFLYFKTKTHKKQIDFIKSKLDSFNKKLIVIKNIPLSISLFNNIYLKIQSLLSLKKNKNQLIKKNINTLKQNIQVFDKDGLNQMKNRLTICQTRLNEIMQQKQLENSKINQQLENQKKDFILMQQENIKLQENNNNLNKENIDLNIKNQKLNNQLEEIKYLYQQEKDQYKLENEQKQKKVISCCQFLKQNLQQMKQELVPIQLLMTNVLPYKQIFKSNINFLSITQLILSKIKEKFIQLKQQGLILKQEKSEWISERRELTSCIQALKKGTDEKTQELLSVQQNRINEYKEQIQLMKIREQKLQLLLRNQIQLKISNFSQVLKQLKQQYTKKLKKVKLQLKKSIVNISNKQKENFNKKQIMFKKLSSQIKEQKMNLLLLFKDQQLILKRNMGLITIMKRNKIKEFNQYMIYNFQRINKISQQLITLQQLKIQQKQRQHQIIVNLKEQHEQIKQNVIKINEWNFIKEECMLIINQIKINSQKLIKNNSYEKNKRQIYRQKLTSLLDNINIFQHYTDDSQRIKIKLNKLQNIITSKIDIIETKDETIQSIYNQNLEIKKATQNRLFNDLNNIRNSIENMKQDFHQQKSIIFEIKRIFKYIQRKRVSQKNQINKVQLKMESLRHHDEVQELRMFLQEFLQQLFDQVKEIKKLKDLMSNQFKQKVISYESNLEKLKLSENQQKEIYDKKTEEIFDQKIQLKNQNIKNETYIDLLENQIQNLLDFLSKKDRKNLLRFYELNQISIFTKFKSKHQLNIHQTNSYVKLIQLEEVSVLSPIIQNDFPDQNFETIKCLAGMLNFTKEDRFKIIRLFLINYIQKIDEFKLNIKGLKQQEGKVKLIQRKMRLVINIIQEWKQSIQIIQEEEMKKLQQKIDQSKEDIYSQNDQLIEKQKIMKILENNLENIGEKIQGIELQFQQEKYQFQEQQQQKELMIDQLHKNLVENKGILIETLNLVQNMKINKKYKEQLLNVLIKNN